MSIDLNNFDKLRAVTYGIPRSGTTQVWQIANHFFPGQVLKTHGYYETDLPTIVIYRDFRDTFCSYLTTITARPFEETPIGLIYSEMSHILEGAEILMKYKLNRPDAMFIRYEDGVSVENIAKYLGIELSNEERDEIILKFSLGENNKIATRMAASGKTFKDGHDNVSLIHAQHISGVDWNQYRTWVGHLFDKALLEWGYL